MKNQKEATVSTILHVLSENAIDYVRGGDVRVCDVLTDVMKAEVRTTLFNMFREGEVSYKDSFQWKCDDDKELKKYISGLVNNWVRKDPEFNCGQKYVAANPGSRQHVGDDQLKALKALSASPDIDEEGLKDIADAIVKRKAELEALKPKNVIKVEALPEHLKHLVKSE